MERFKDNLVVVTGGSSGIGLATVEAFAKEGAHVIVSDLRSEDVERTAQALRAEGFAATGIATDVTDPDAVETAVSAIVQRFGRIDVLVNSAGIMAPGAADAVTPDKEWRRSISVNLDGCLYWARAVAKGSMLERRAGAIVNVASGAGLFAVPDNVGYVVSKHAVVGLTRSLALDWARFGIRVNCVCPGLTETEMVRKAWADNQAGLESRRRRTPMGRSATPEEQAGPILFLASEAASYVTGLIMPVDGGTSAMLSGSTPRFDD